MTSEYFWKKTNWERLIVGTTLSIIAGSIFGNPCKCYRRKGDDFVRVFDSQQNPEFMYQLQENKQLKDGIYKIKFEDGKTQLGYQYFDRTFAATGEDRKYCLHMTVSGDIQYLEQIKSSTTNEWKTTVTKFVFNKETFTWTKAEL